MGYKAVLKKNLPRAFWVCMCSPEREQPTTTTLLTQVDYQCAEKMTMQVALQSCEGQEKLVPWTVTLYMSRSNVKYQSKVNLYCVPSTISHKSCTIIMKLNPNVRQCTFTQKEA